GPGGPGGPAEPAGPAAPASPFSPGGPGGPGGPCAPTVAMKNATCSHVLPCTLRRYEPGGIEGSVARIAVGFQVSGCSATSPIVTVGVSVGRFVPRIRI